TAGGNHGRGPLAGCDTAARWHSDSPGMSHMRLLLLALLLVAAPAQGQPYAGPIIDVHLHVGPAAPGAPNPATGEQTTAATDAEREGLTLERMRRHGIVLGLVSGPD